LRVGRELGQPGSQTSHLGRNAGAWHRCCQRGGHERRADVTRCVGRWWR